MKIQVTAIGEILFDVYPGNKTLGGAPFNFLYHVWKLTGNGNLISRIGNDTEGDEIIHFLNERGFNTGYIQKDQTRATGTVHVKLDKNKVPDFKIKKNRAYDFIELNTGLSELAVRSDLFYFGSLAQRNVTSRNTIQSLAAKARKVLCDLNIRQRFYDREIIRHSLLKSNVVKLNVDELKLVADFLLEGKSDMQLTAQNLLNKYDLDLLCITLGEEGALLFDGNKLSHHKAKAENIVDTVGAGDAYAAMMSIGYLHSWETGKINQYAAEFAAEVCKIAGAIPRDETLYDQFREKINNGQ